MVLSWKEEFAVGAGFLTVVMAGAIGWGWGPGIAAILSVGVGTAVILAGVFVSIRRLDKRTKKRDHLRQRRLFWQIEAVLSVLATLRPDRPLPATRSWAASPDLLRTLVNHIFEQKPERVLELGSGVSTLVMAHVLNRTGGHVTALEQDAEYAQKTRDTIRLHGLEETATVVHAPLRSFDIAGEEWLWYDWNGLNDATMFDLLFVDGPSGNVQSLARYPGLPLLNDQLDDGCTIVLDDAHREEEQKVAKRWLTENPLLVREEHLNLEKGALILRKQQNRRGDTS